MQNKDEISLRDLVGAQVSIQVGEARIKVKPLGWFDAMAALEAITPALATMPSDVLGNEVGVMPQSTASKWVAWLTGHRVAVLTFCTIASKLQEDDLREIPPLALVELFFGLVEVNADFFVQSLPAVAPRMASGIEALSSRIVKALEAQQSLPSSSKG